MGDEYSFLQETIKDEAGSVKTLRKKIFRNVLCGIIFGAVACFTFFALKPWVEGIFGQDTVEVNIPGDEETEVLEREEARKEELRKEQEKERQEAKLFEKVHAAAKTAKRAVVTITGKNSMGEVIQKTSGVIIADNGEDLLILSSNYSEKKQNNIKVRFIDGREYTAVLKKQDKNLGLGIYAVAADSLKKETLDQIKMIELGNSKFVEKGDPVVLISNSSEQGLNIGYGILADDQGRKIISDGYTAVLLVDAAGVQYQDGVMLNQEGQLIAIMESSLQDHSILAGAYSISGIKSEIEHMSNGQAVPYCGVRGTTIPEQLKEKGVESGIYVEEVDADSPAMEAGIQCGDIITHIAAAEISDMEQFRRMLLAGNVKEELMLKGLRKGADSEYVEVEFKVIVGTK